MVKFSGASGKSQKFSFLRSNILFNRNAHLKAFGENAARYECSSAALLAFGARVTKAHRKTNISVTTSRGVLETYSVPIAVVCNSHQWKFKMRILNENSEDSNLDRVYAKSHCDA